VLLRRTPPGPEKRPPPFSSPSSMTVLFPKLTDRLSPAPVRPYLLSRNFVTRKMSPSLRPSVRKSLSVISGRFSSPIWSPLNARAYRSQIWGFTPHWRKKSNQSYLGFCSTVIPAPPDEWVLSACSFALRVFFRLMSARGLSSSNEIPVARSTYSRSSMAIFGTGTAIFTPLVLCK
jgi:hypothetical protein